MISKTYRAAASLLALACLGFTWMSDAAEAAAPAANTEQKTEAPSPAQDLEGNWGGTLMGALRLILHVKKSPAGDYTAVLESLDQGHTMIPVDKVDVTSSHLNLSIASVNGSFDAQWDTKTDAWVGKWVQGRAMPLTLTRVNGEPPKAKRPQEDTIDTGPLPYGRHAVSFDGAAANVKLAGTFSMPPGKGPFPAVVLIAGSGAQTRDEEVLGHKVFLVLSDYLTRRGIAVLRYDKRGVGESTGDYESATTAEFTADAEAAVAYLRHQSKVDMRHIGLIGHSEGGLIAPAIAAQDPKVRFIVLLAGPAMRGDKLLAEQIYLIAKAGGAPEDKAAMSRKVHEEVFTAIADAPNTLEAKTAAEAILDKAIKQHQISIEYDKTRESLDRLSSPWMRYFFKYDPMPTLRQVKVPVLAINGSLDLQVPPQEDLASIKEALHGDKDVTVMELPKLNHLFQSANTGTPAEYGTIVETFDPAALKIIGDWVSTHGK